MMVGEGEEFGGFSLGKRSFGDIVKLDDSSCGQRLFSKQAGVERVKWSEAGLNSSSKHGGTAVLITRITVVIVVRNCVYV